MRRERKQRGKKKQTEKQRKDDVKDRMEEKAKKKNQKPKGWTTPGLNGSAGRKAMRGSSGARAWQISAPLSPSERQGDKVLFFQKLISKSRPWAPRT